MKLIIDALKAIINETADFRFCLDKIEFLEDTNCLLISTQTVPEDVKTSIKNKYALRDNFFKAYLGVSVQNLEGKYSFLIHIDELSELKIITDKINTLQNPPVLKNKLKSSVEPIKIHRDDLKTLLEMTTPTPNILSKFGCTMHFIDLNSSPDGVPHGREFITKNIDKKIKENTDDVLIELNVQNGLDNTLFINFTGHEAPVASALYMNGIDCIWQVSIKNDPTSQTRIMDQLQDSLPRNELLLSSTFHDSALGLILEPNHGFTQIDAKKLPSLDQLKAFGIRQIVLFTEKNYNQGKCVYQLDEQYFKREMQFYRWFQSLAQDFNLLTIGVANFEECSEENVHSIGDFFKKKDTTTSSTYKVSSLYTFFKEQQQNTEQTSSKANQSTSEYDINLD